MTVRFYVLPIERNGNYRGPKYFVWSKDPDPPGLGDPTKTMMMDYGLIDFGIVCSDISAADHATVSANADVLSIPVNLDNTLNAGAVTTVKNFLENFNIPANWINAGVTYRSVLRTVMGMFQFMQRFTAILGRPVNFTNTPLSTQYGSLPADVQAALLQAAQELGYDTSSLTANTTLRAILKFMADGWGATPLLFGSLATL